MRVGERTATIRIFSEAALKSLCSRLRLPGARLRSGGCPSGAVPGPNRYQTEAPRMDNMTNPQAASSFFINFFLVEYRQGRRVSMESAAELRYRRRGR